MKRLLLTLLVMLGARDIRAAETVTNSMTPTMPDSIPSTWLTYHLAHPGPDKAIPADPNCAIH